MIVAGAGLDLPVLCFMAMVCRFNRYGREMST